MKILLLLLIASMTPSFVLSENAFHNYFWANYQQFAGNREETRKWYEHIFSDAHHSLLNNKGYLHFLAESGNHKKIVELMPKLKEIFAKDPDVQLIFVQALRQTGNKNEADNLLITLSQTFKDHTEVVFNAAETLVQRKEHKNALALLDTYLNSAPRRPNNFIFYFLKGQIYMQMKDFTQARNFIQQCLEAHPRFPQGWLLKAMLEEEAGQIEQAIKGFSSYLELSGPNKQIERHLLELVLKQKATQKKNNVIVLNRSCFEKALILFEKRQYQEALHHVNSCLAQNDQDMQARLLKIQILTAMQEYTQTIKTLIAWIDQEPQNLIWLQTLHLLARTNAPIEKIINAFNTLATKYPNNVATHLYLADLHTRAGNDHAALRAHQKALPLVSDARIKTRTLFQISTLQYERGEYESMLQTIAELEKVNPHFAPALNMLAYYYATEGKDLTKAETLFNKAYAIDKGNPHLLDTKAVILYKQKKYNDALKLLKPLAQKMQHDSAVHIHLAKTYAKMGQYDNARNAIDQAQQYAQTPYEKRITAVLSYAWNQHTI